MRSKIHVNCVYEDPPPDSSQTPPSPPVSSIVPTRAQDVALDLPIEATDPTNAGDLQPSVRKKATTIQLPPPMPLENFRPLLLTDHEDPLLYALSDISLEDMNMSLYVPLLSNHK